MASTAQTWALIGIVGAFASTALSAMFFSFQSLRGLLEAKFEAVTARFDGVDRRLDGVDQRLDGVDRRLDAVDRDVQALTNRVFRDRP